MTLDTFRDKAAAEALPKGGAKSLDPVTLAVLLAVLTSVISEIAVKCVDQLWPKSVTNPGPIQRARLRWLYVRPAVKVAIAANPEAHCVDAWQVEGLVTQGILTAAKGLSDEELEGLKANALATRA